MLVISLSAQVNSEPMVTAKESINFVFTNQNKEDTINPLTTREMTEAQQHDQDLETKAEMEGYATQLVKTMKVLCKMAK